MLMFIIGVLVGGMLGFAVCAICSATGSDDRKETLVNKETGGKDAAGNQR